jgi:hypothetical protein
MAPAEQFLATWVGCAASLWVPSRWVTRWSEGFFARRYVSTAAPGAFSRPTAKSSIPQADKLEPFLGPRGPWP